MIFLLLIEEVVSCGLTFLKKEKKNIISASWIHETKSHKKKKIINFKQEQFQGSDEPAGSAASCVRPRLVLNDASEAGFSWAPENQTSLLEGFKSKRVWQQQIGYSLPWACLQFLFFLQAEQFELCCNCSCSSFSSSARCSDKGIWSHYFLPRLSSQPFILAGITLRGALA